MFCPIIFSKKYHNGTYRKCGKKAVSSSSISEGISGNRQGFGSNSKKFLSILQKPVLRLGIPSLRSSMTGKEGMSSMTGKKRNWRHPDVEHRGTEGSSYADGITSFLQNDWILRRWLRMTRNNGLVKVVICNGGVIC